MKDSQLLDSSMMTESKYIKANNERFSTFEESFDEDE